MARKVIKTAWENVAFALIVKIAVMIMGLLGYANMWVAVFADTGVTILCILYAVRLLRVANRGFCLRVKLYKTDFEPFSKSLRNLRKCSNGRH